jgi:large subunit ribosomal protein L25
MADAAILKVEARTETGKNKTKRLRANGKIPAVVYGHGGETVSISVPADELNTLLREGSRIVSLQGSVNEDAFIRDVQWDVYGSSVLHLDFTRVTAGESIETTVLIECRGDAPGLRAGGVVEQLLQDLEVTIPATSMTDKIEVNINALELGESITVGQLELPSGAKVDVDPETVVVQCVERVEVEEEEVSIGPVEPEIIGRKDDEQEGE